MESEDVIGMRGLIVTDRLRIYENTFKKHIGLSIGSWSSHISSRAGRRLREVRFQRWRAALGDLPSIVKPSHWRDSTNVYSNG
jgi:hypothetical protein